MKKRLLIAFFVVLLALSAFVTLGVVRAQSPAFTLTRSVIGSGGMGGSASGYTLHSTLGQPVAGSVSGGQYTFSSGFWGQALMEWFENFLPLILN
ncbi:MAG: hypothetical protein MUO40_07985 [Anaerolineaceae bacterium]|nr:hypothetical protein [Anaerolineaceae bacterium]